MKDVIVVTGSGSIAQAVARRVSMGKHILLSDIKPEIAEAVEHTLSRAGFSVSTTVVDVSSRRSVQNLVKEACRIGDVKVSSIPPGYRLRRQKRRTLLELIYMAAPYSLRVMAEAVKWGKCGARINCISAGIIYTPLAYDELNSVERGAFYQNMLTQSPAGRGGTPDEIGALAEFLFGPSGTYINGSDILIDGGATASYKYGELKS